MAKQCRLCAPENQQYALLTEVLDVVKLDDTLRTSIIPDDLMRATSQEWRRIQRDNVPIKLDVHEPAAKSPRKARNVFERQVSRDRGESVAEMF